MTFLQVCRDKAEFRLSSTLRQAVLGCRPAMSDNSQCCMWVSKPRWFIWRRDKLHPGDLSFFGSHLLHKSPFLLPRGIISNSFWFVSLSCSLFFAICLITLIFTWSCFWLIYYIVNKLNSLTRYFISYPSGVSFRYNADVMTSALFGTFKTLKLSFPATCIYFGKVSQLKNTSMFHFHGFQPVSKDCLHVAMCTNSIS